VRLFLRRLREENDIGKNDTATADKDPAEKVLRQLCGCTEK